MAWNKRFVKYMGLLVAILLTATACTVSYKFNGASINYDKVKTITIEEFPNRASYVWGPMAPMFNTDLQDIYVQQTRLQQVKRGGDLHLSGEITAYDQYNKSVSAEGYSSVVELKMVVNVRFANNTNHSEDFEKTFSATCEYDATQQLSAVQEELVTQMVDEITEQIFNATVANW
ncbi:MAG: LptE family protein [Bacteroidaceae bacterium]|nr:LptE family protein [Bacteroidaceae bacterium]